MRPLFARRHQETVADNPILEQPIGEAGPQPYSPYDFVADHTDELSESAVMWVGIGQTAEELTRPDSVKEIRDRIVELFEANGSTKAEIANMGDMLDYNAVETAKSLEVLMLLSARQFSKTEMKLSDAIGVKSSFDESKSDCIYYVIRGRKRQAAGYSKRIVNIGMKMQEADILSEAVLNGLADSLSTRPDLAVDMQTLFGEGIASSDPNFRELQRMINQDWHSQGSVLKRFLAGLSEDPRPFIEGFSRKVEDATQDKKILAARSMAEFAVAILSEGDSPKSVTEVLRDNYEKWNQFAAITEPFEAYVKSQVYFLQQQLGAIAGPQRKNSIRTVRTDAEISEFKRTLQATIGLPEKTNRPKRKSTGGRSRSIPTPEDIHSEIREEEPERQLFIVKTIMNGDQKRLIPEEATVESAVGSFVKNANGHTEDLRTIVRAILERPISRASLVLEGPKGRANIEGKSLPVWRFAPDDAQGLEINGSNRYYRVVYALRAGNVYVLDILDHNQFTQKYG